MKDFTPSDWMDGKDAKRQGRYTQFAMAATNLALEDAKLDAEALEKVDKDKFGVLIGSGIGGVEFFENNCNKFTEAGAGAKGLKKVQSNGCDALRKREHWKPDEPDERDIVGFMSNLVPDAGKPLDLNAVDEGDFIFSPELFTRSVLFFVSLPLADQSTPTQFEGTPVKMPT